MRDSFNDVDHLADDETYCVTCDQIVKTENIEICENCGEYGCHQCMFLNDFGGWEHSEH